MINVHQTLTGNDGFTRVDNTLLRLYPLLPGFSIEATGLYAFFRSWMNTNPQRGPMNSAWLSREEIFAISGYGRTKFERNLDSLTRYGLIEVTKSSRVRANKHIFKVNDPLTEAEFRAVYPEAIEELQKRLLRIKEDVEADAKQFEEKKRARLAEQSQETRVSDEAEPPAAEADPQGEIMAWL